MESTERPILRSEHVTLSWAKFSVTKRDRPVSGEPKTIADHIVREKAALVTRKDKTGCVQLTLPLKVH
eukprot:1721499-Pyramimonas_sp.AAC.1